MTSRHRRALALLLAVPALAVGVAACGGDDDGGGGEKLSKPDYQAQLRKVCADGKKRTDALAEPTTPDGAAMKKFLNEALAITRDSNDKLKNLNPPDELKAAHDAAVAYRDEVASFLEDLVGKIPDGNDPAALQSALQPLQDKSDEFEQRGDKLAADLGVPECAES